MNDYEFEAMMRIAHRKPLQNKIDILEKQNAIMRQALVKIANPDNWMYCATPPIFRLSETPDEIAENALKEVDNEKGN